MHKFDLSHLTSEGLRGPHLRAAWHTLLNWLVILGGMLLYNGLNALALILVARNVAPDVYGQYLAAFALASFLVVLPGFGMDAWLLTQPQGERAATSALWWSTLRARIPLLGLWVLGMLGLTFFLPTATYPPAILWPTVIGLGLESISLVSFATLRTQDRHWQITLLQGSSAGLLLLLVLLLPVSQQYIVQFAVGRALISAVVALVAVLLLARDYRRSRAPLTPSRSILRASRSFMVAELASAVYVRADLTIIALFLGAAGTGIYGPAVNILQLAFLPLRALFFFFVPVLSRAYRAGRRLSFRQQALVQLTVEAGLGLFFSVLLFLLGPQMIILVFGDVYADAGAILRLLSPIPFLRGLSFALAAVLTSSDRQGPRTRVQVAAALFNVAGNLLLVRSFGIAGVAVVYVLSELLLAAGYGYLSLGARGRRHYTEVK